MQLNRRQAVVSAALLAAGLALPAAPSAFARRAAGTSVPVTATGTDLIAPETAAAGTITFEVSTDDAESGWVGLVRLRAGADWERFRTAYEQVGSTDRDEILAGSRELERIAVLLGGVQTRPGGPGTFTAALPAGSYLLFEHQDFRYQKPERRHRVIRLTGQAGHVARPAPSATVTATMVDGTGPRLVVSGRIRAGATISFANHMAGQANEAILWRLADGTTDADVHAWIAKFGDTGEFPADRPPFVDEGPAGLLPISTGRSYVAVPALEAGRYAILNWMKDARDGTMLLKKGMYEIVDVSA